MKSMSIRAAMFAALMFAVCLTHAFGQGMPAAMPRFLLLLDPSVRQELKLSPAQAQKVDARLKEMRSENGKGIMLRAGMNLAKLDAEIQGVLSPGQKRRLFEIWVQREGGMALADDSVARSVGLTPKQRSQVAEIVQEMRDSMRQMAMSQGGGRVESRGIRQRAQGRIVALLNPAQKTRLKKLQGKPFARPRRA